MRNIILCGHFKCAGVAAILNGLKKYGPSIYNWMSHAQSVANKTLPLKNDPDARWNAAVEENLRWQLENLRTYRCVQRRTSANDLQIQGWIYDLHGTILILNSDSNKFAKIRNSGDEPG